MHGNRAAPAHGGDPRTESQDGTTTPDEIAVALPHNSPRGATSRGLSGTGVGCCGPAIPAPAARGLATGIEGGLLRTPLTVIDVSTPSGEQADGCCN
jgi:hypothetical protein